MKHQGYLETLAVYLCASSLLPSALALAEPLNLTIPKTEPETGLRIFSLDQNNLTPATLFMLSQIVKKIERSALTVPWPRLGSGKRVYGSIRIAITIQMDGTIVEIEPTSGWVNDADQLLIEAATKTIESAAPFGSLPRDHFPGSDAIRFSRTFNFNYGEKAVVN